MSAWNAFWNPPAGGIGFEDNRSSRYDWFWKMYWNTAYDELSSYVANYPTASQLYRFTRGLRNPVGRYVDFYVANVWGGMLDQAAGDGKETSSALPLVVDDDMLRAAIAKIWQWSNWSAKRNLAVLYSTTLGDAFIKVVDRPSSQRCYLQTRWPGEFTEVTWDDFGHVKSCTIEYQALDDEGKTFAYKEIIEHPSVWGGTTTRFRTFKDNRPWAFKENVNGLGVAVAEWTAPYDFVPVVHVPWVDVGQGWGAVGFVKTQRKIDAANALASQLADQVGKAVNTPLIAYGIQATDVAFTSSPDGVPILYVNRTPSEAKIEPLIGDLNIEHGLKVLDGQLGDISQDLPELRLSEALRSGMSGEALGRAFSDVLAQIQAVRSNHDSALVRAQQMAVAIAGASGYAPEFAGFNLASFAQGRLDHSIGGRPVLPRSSEEDLQELKDRWAMVKEAVASGAPLSTALREIMGWSKPMIRAMERDEEAEKQRGADLTTLMLEEARRKFDAGGGQAGQDSTNGGQDSADGPMSDNEE
jgi:hypothetical protein